MSAPDREDWSAWEYIRAAESLGWCDSGKTEPLSSTLDSAIAFLIEGGHIKPQGEREWNAIGGYVP